jgi:hypothetical protein
MQLISASLIFYFLSLLTCAKLPKKRCPTSIPWWVVSRCVWGCGVDGGGSGRTSPLSELAVTPLLSPMVAAAKTATWLWWRRWPSSHWWRLLLFPHPRHSSQQRAASPRVGTRSSGGSGPAPVAHPVVTVCRGEPHTNPHLSIDIESICFWSLLVTGTNTEQNSLILPSSFLTENNPDLF